MPAKKTRKSKKQRGSATHGWGAMKKHRGAGNRGGVGMAGSGKRADQKKPTILKLYGTEYFGKHGFTSIKKAQKGINLDDLQTLSKEEVIKLKDLGFDKVLSRGKVTKKLKIYADSFSKKAKEKIEKAGGEAIITLKKKPVKEENAKLK